jgi:hypothetical protein
MSDQRRDDDDGGDLDLGRHERKPGWLATYGQPLWRILILLVMLVGIVLLRKPCSEGVAGFIGNFGPPPEDAGAPPPRARRGPASAPTPAHLGGMGASVPASQPRPGDAAVRQ